MLIQLQPTSPLRTAEDIDNAVELLFEKKAGAIVSVCETEHHPGWVNRLPKSGCMKNFIKPEACKNRQELDRFYRLNGAISLGWCDYIKRQRSFFGNDTFAYVMPREKSLDIDNEIDFELAKLLKKGYK